MARPVLPAEQVAPLESVADGGPELVTAAYLLSSEIFQIFGCPEILQLTREGQLRLPYWSNERRPVLKAWEQESGIEIVEETVEAG